MRVLFIVRGKKEGISPFIKLQAESLRRQGVELSFFKIQGKGILAYFLSARKLRYFLKEKKVDVLHAHYGLSAWTAVLSYSRLPIIVSLMGSDILGEYQKKDKISLKSKIVVFLTHILEYFVQAIIAKSNNIYTRIYRKSIVTVIPNGVDVDKFNNKETVTRKDLGLKEGIKYILFLGNPKDRWKNFDLAVNAVKLIQSEKVQLIAPFPIPHKEVVKYLNVADVFLHTSFMEGSSNVIKEAMACNCPIVYTEVGDASWVVGETEGCFLTSFSDKQAAEKLALAIKYSDGIGRTKGIMRIRDLELDSESIAKRIISIYKNTISQR